jgi:hypothetical protein
VTHAAVWAKGLWIHWRYSIEETIGDGCNGQGQGLELEYEIWPSRRQQRNVQATRQLSPSGPSSACASKPPLLR